MIRVLLKQKLDEKAFSERRRITLSEVSEVTGISRATLNRIANVPGYKTSTDVISSLCFYFECSPGDLLQHYPDKAKEQV